MTKSKKKIVNIVSGALLAAVILLVAFMLVSKVSGNLSFVAGRSAVWVMTDSMEDEIPAKSYIWVKKVDPEKVKVGDVIVFKSEDPALQGSLNTHRVVEIIGNNTEFVTRGDHNLKNDDYPVPAANIKAVYLRKLPVMTFIGRAFMTTTGIIVSVFLILILCSAVYLPDIIKNFRTPEEQTEKTMDERIAEEVEKLKKENAEKQNDDGTK